MSERLAPEPERIIAPASAGALAWRLGILVVAYALAMVADRRKLTA